MPEPTLTARPVRVRHPAPFPSAFQHLQVAMPGAPGVDAHAVVVDLAPEADPGAIDAAVRRHWWSADHGQLEVRRASARDLAAEGAPVLRASDLGWVDPIERAMPGFPLAPDDDLVERRWVRARRGSVEGWMPYTAAVARPGDARPDEPLTHPPLLGGFGAGADPDDARAQAGRTVVVEDALWCWWTGLAPAASLDPVARVRELWADADVELTLRRLDRGVLGPVTLAAVDDGRILTVGGGCGLDAFGQRAAIARALWQLVLARSLDDPGSDLHALGVPGVVPHRPDRRYAPADPRARRRLLDPLVHVQLALDPRVRTALRGRLDDLRPGPPAVSVAAETWTVDLAPDGRVVRVVAPAAIPLPLGAFRLDPALVAAAARRPGANPVTAAATAQNPFPGW
ncbi:YcaO-like family protein [Microbacterium testaceum]|uniref:YcaO domain-containing protein n=1 Tax=Microbacterium testaceum TaxID=2033 RepID=A0A147F3U6_MICTE|nr:YcaO-like family protein [Microbacterium testaceum]KTS08296.1 hypothetical protein RSA3_15710 [Microbacterium testaceum]